MKKAFFGRGAEALEKKEERVWHRRIVISLCAAALLSLSLIAADCENYSGEDSAEAVSLTYTPPEKEQGKGLWDIFYEAITNMMSGIY